MKSKTMGKMVVDLGMTVLLMLLMAYELIGRTVHEWIGMWMFVLFILHHILNRNWSKNLLRRKYPPLRILQVISAGLVLLTMLGSMISAVLISRTVFSFLPVSGGREFGRTLHMLSAYWGLVFLSLHLGIHWNTFMGMAGRLCGKPSRLRRIVLRVLGACVALYGIYAFISRGIPGYLFFQTQFVFFDFEEPLFFFFLDYLAVMGLFIWAGHYLASAVRLLQKGEADR